MVRFGLSVTILGKNHGQDRLEWLGTSDMTDVSNTTVHHNGTCIVNGTDFASFNERIPQQKTIRISQKIGKKYNWTDDQVSQIEASFFYG